MPKTGLIKGKTKAQYTADYYQLNKKYLTDKRKILQKTNLKSKLHTLLNNAVARNSKYNSKFDLTIEYLLDLWNQQNGCCALSGVPLEIHDGLSRTRTFNVSLDRIENSVGYEQGNVQLVAAKLNYMRGISSIDEFITLCKKVVAHNA